MRVLLALLTLFIVATNAASVEAQNRTSLAEIAVDRGDPVDLLLDMRRELRLSREQVYVLQQIQARLDRENQPHVERLLEIHREVRAQFASSDGGQVRLPVASDAQLDSARARMLRIQENNLEAMERIGHLLTDRQKREAAARLRFENRRSDVWQGWIRRPR